MLIDFRIMGLFMTRTVEAMSAFVHIKRANSCRVFDSLEADQDNCMDSRMAALKGTTSQRRIHSGVLQKRCRVSGPLNCAVIRSPAVGAPCKQAG